MTDAAHDVHLLQRVAAGDRGRPLEELYDRYHRRVWAVGLRRMGDRDGAEDVVQETFVRLWHSAARFDPTRDNVGALLMTIADRAIDDLARRRDGQAGGGQALLRDELQAALATMPPGDREVLRLRFRENLAEPEIARRLDLPLSTVRSRVSRALRDLRAAASFHGERPATPQAPDASEWRFPAVPR